MRCQQLKIKRQLKQEEYTRLCEDKVPGGRPKTSGKSHNKISKTYLTAGRDQASTSIVLPATGTSSIINYVKRPAEKSANVDVTEDIDIPPSY